LLAGAQAFEYLKPLKPGVGTSVVYNKIRVVVKPLGNDRLIYEDLKKVAGLIKDNSLLNSVQEKVSLK
jgi:histidine ammonia-lyase